MPKRLRQEPLYIAPGILGWRDENYRPHVIDEKNHNRVLDPTNIDDKIVIYQRQVEGWFLFPATNMTRFYSQNKGFIVLMICLSYLEGVEQYRRGQTSHNNSANFFINALNRIYPNMYTRQQLRNFYSEARCGLFHSGMVQGSIIINSDFNQSIEFINEDIRVNPSLLLQDIKIDFNNYIRELRTNALSRDRFDSMFSNL